MRVLTVIDYAKESDSGSKNLYTYSTLNSKSYLEVPNMSGKRSDNMMMVTLGRRNCVLRKKHNDKKNFMLFFITSLHSGC